MFLSRTVRNVHRMHTAVKLNEVIRENSSDARLVIVNLPPLPKRKAGDKSELHCILHQSHRRMAVYGI